MSKPKKKGKLEEIDGKKALVKENGMAYEVTENTIEVWNKCTGRNTVQSIAESIIQKSGIESDSKKRVGMEDAVYKTINQLEDAGLVETG